MYNNLTRSNNPQNKSPIKQTKQSKRKEGNNMKYYYITYNNYFGYCVIETDGKNGKIVFAGTIEDCDAKCMDLNSHR